MFIFFQKLWVLIFVDGFLLYLIVRLVREKVQKRREDKKIGPAPKPEIYRGKVLYYDFYDGQGIDQSGSIKKYPCLLGRGKNCDVQIIEQAKKGRYYVPKEFIQITETADGFRVTRCRRHNGIQELMTGISDGKRFEGEVSMTFQRNIRIKITPRVILELEKYRFHTSALTR